MYIWEHPDWPTFSWRSDRLIGALVDVRHAQGRLLGRMEGLGFRLQEMASLKALTQDVVMTSEIEGERLDPNEVRSSIARRLGLDIGGLIPADRAVEGVVEMTLDATRQYHRPLSEQRIYHWHAALFPSGRSGKANLRVGAWRDDAHGPMEVISGPHGKERTHFVAPPADRLGAEIPKFLEWFNGEGDIDPVIRAGLAHLWFVTIHPFEDGNGRIARAIADMALSRADRSGQRFYSMSSQIRRERSDYYDILEATQKGDLDVTLWLAWFLGCLGRAIAGAQDLLASSLFKARYWERFGTQPLNQRQIKVLNIMLDDFVGKMTTGKWAKLGKCSQDTAYRDILDLIERGALTKNPAGGRSTSYSLTEV